MAVLLLPGVMTVARAGVVMKSGRKCLIKIVIQSASLLALIPIKVTLNIRPMSLLLKMAALWSPGYRKVRMVLAMASMGSAIMLTGR